MAWNLKLNTVSKWTSVAAASFTMPESGPQIISLDDYSGVSDVVVTDTGGDDTYVEGTDYSVDSINGAIAAISGGAITVGEELKISFNYNGSIDALDASDCFGDPAGDPSFDSHLAAAQAAALATLQGLTGSATTVDVSVECVPDSGPETPYSAGTQISITVVERY